MSDSSPRTPQHRAKAFPASKEPRRVYPQQLEAQLDALSSDPLPARMAAGRRFKAGDRYRPNYHFVNPENTLNDPNGLCFWQGKWHLFYQVRPPEDERLHWGHAVSDDLIRWRDLPYALLPGPENDCYSGTTLVEADRVVAMYHGTELGNMVALSNDPLLLNWTKLGDGAVIPFEGDGGVRREYGIFDPCIWKQGSYYYALSAGIEPFQPRGRHLATNFLFRSEDLENWDYLHPFVEGDRFTIPGDDGACPYFWPIGDKHILLFFSHMSGGQYLIGNYDTEAHKFHAQRHGFFNFGATFPDGVHAPTAAPMGNGSVVVLFNMNPAKPTVAPDPYLRDFFGVPKPEEMPEEAAAWTARDWDQVMTLPRRLTLLDDGALGIAPVGALESLRGEHQSLGGLRLPANRKMVLPGLQGDSFELSLELEPGQESVLELNVLRSPDREEFTRISYFHKRGYKYREPFADDARAHRIMSSALSNPVRHESILSIDTSRASTLPDALARPPEQGPVFLEDGEPLRLRVFVDRSAVEVFANERQCLAVRVYPGRADSLGVSLVSRGQDAVVSALDFWEIKYAN